MRFEINKNKPQTMLIKKFAFVPVKCFITNSSLNRECFVWLECYHKHIENHYDAICGKWIETVIKNLTID